MVVSFRNMGRLGNFLFQFSTAWAYAKKHDLDFTVPNFTNDRHWNPIYLQHLAKKLPSRENIVIKEHGHEFQDLPFDESWRVKNIILDGYFQSDKYFKEYESELRDIIQPEMVPMKGVTSIHLRYGDYKLYPTKHPPMNPDYYDAAVKMIFEKTGNTRFRVFSDEPHNARKFIEHRLYYGVDFEFISGNNEQTDMRLISECENHIGSSSTFSWWGAWLNPNKEKIVITPSNWFVEGHGGLDTKDIIPDNWIKI